VPPLLLARPPRPQGLQGLLVQQELPAVQELPVQRAQQAEPRVLGLLAEQK